MKTEDAITALKELMTGTSKRSKIGQIRELMPYIEGAMKSGVTLADIHATLTEKCGLDIKLITFIGSYKRIKKEQKAKPNKTPAATEDLDKPNKEEKPKTTTGNPFAKANKTDGDIRRNQFEYNPTPDLTKIYGDNNDE
jgi:hypothetical protein